MRAIYVWILPDQLLLPLAFAGGLRIDGTVQGSVHCVGGEGSGMLVISEKARVTGKVKAGDLVNHVAQQVGGKGGGRPDMAQAGGTNPAALPEALRSIEAWLEQRL